MAAKSFLLQQLAEPHHVPAPVGQEFRKKALQCPAEAAVWRSHG